MLGCGLSSFALVDWSFAHAHLGSYYEGYDLPKVARGLLSLRNGLTHDERVARLEGFPPIVRQRVTLALGFNIGTLHVGKRRAAARAAGTPDDWSVDLAALVAPYPENLRAEIARGIGIALRFDNVMRGRGPAELSVRLDRVWADPAQSQSPDLVRALAQGACSHNPVLPLESQTEQVLATTAVVIDVERGALRTALLRGHGAICGRLVRRGIPSDLARVDHTSQAIAAEDRAPFCVGFGEGLAEGGEGPAVSRTMLDLVPATSRPDVWRGFGAGLLRIYGSDAGQAASPFQVGLDAAESRGLEQGLGGTERD
jgi:hypothetical protein